MEGRVEGQTAFFVGFFVTPISTLANCKRSYPTNSTTPDRLRIAGTPGRWILSGVLGRGKRKNHVLSCPLSRNQHLQPKKCP